MTWILRAARFLLPMETLPLRWQLVTAFLLVSMIPVLLASLVAAQLIAGLFRENMERWLVDAARFVVARSIEDEAESKRAATIVAATLAINAGQLNQNAIELSAELLTLIGYEAVAVYDESGKVLYWRGDATPGDWLPRTERSGLFLVSEAGQASLLLGATQRFLSNGVAHFIFIGDRWDRTVIDLPGAGAALQIRVFAVSDGQSLHLQTGTPGAWHVPADVVARLAAGEESVVEKVSDADNLATGFAALRDVSGRLVGVVASRLPSDIALLSHIRTLELFCVLVLGAGMLSFFAALSLSKLISRPLDALTRGLRRVGEGDYKARVSAEGGRELVELAEGFNGMTEQLDGLRQRETMMRRRERFAALGEAAAVIAHEIRNPLGIIKTSSEVIRMHATPPAESERLVGYVLDEVGRIDHLVQDLLDYVSPKEGVQTRVDVTQELNNVLDFAAPELERRRIVPLLIAPEREAVIIGDPAQLHQAFLNILINAIDAMPGGGRLTAAVLKEDGEVVVSIADSGIGVAPGISERMFEPFVTDKPHGTGLGLARVMHVVEAHGGSIQCQSEPGQGTTFTLRLPAAGGA